MYSLNEVSKFTGLTISQIDKYENEGIVSLPKNKGTHYPTLYDEEGVKNLLICKIYNELGYTKPKLKKIINDSNVDNDLPNAIVSLEEKIKKLQEILSIVKYIEKNELELSIIFDMFNLLRQNEIVEYSTMIQLLANIMPALDLYDIDEKANEETEKLFDEFFDSFFNLISNININTEYTSKETQEIISNCYKVFAKKIYASVLMFQSILIPFFTLKDISDDFENEFGIGSLDYIKSAINCYCNNYRSVKDIELLNVFNNIETFKKNGYNESSSEIQNEVEKIYLIYKGIPYFNNHNLEGLMKSLLNNLNVALTQKNGNNDYYETTRFIYRSVEIFINKTFYNQ